MSEEVILQFMAQDDISPVLSSMQTNIITAMEDIQATITNMGSGFDNASKSVANTAKSEQTFVGGTKESTDTVKENTKSVKDNTSSSKQNSDSKTKLGNATKQSNAPLSEQNKLLESHTNFATLSAGSAMYLAGQLSTLGTKAEQSAHNLNELKIQVDQVAKMSGMAEDEMVDLVTYISNETFPNDEAALYIKNLTQMGVESENFAEQATNIDRINDAFGLGAETTNSLVTELAVLGVDANHIEDSFNALAYANENTKGGMENFYSFLRKYDAEFNELGYNMDQSTIIISAATQKFGGGRAALTGLSEALKNAGSDTSAMEQELGLIPGALSHATDETASYEGQLQSLADEELEHKTILDRVGAFLDDIKLKYSGVFTTLESGMGVLGATGNLALTGLAMREFMAPFVNSRVITNTIERLRMFNKVQQETQLLSKVTPAQASMMAGGTLPIPQTGGGKTTGSTGKSSFFGRLFGSSPGKGMDKVSKETTSVVKGASGVGAMAPEATTAGATTKATATGLKGIGSGITSMIAPLLQISAVIMIMLPVLALIAAEALVLLKGLQMLIKALGFDKIDLSKSIESIKQIGSALWEIGKAMGALTFATLMTAITMFTTGILQLSNPIGSAGQALVQVANELQIFNSVNIDKSVPTKIKSITDSMGLVTDAMNKLVNITLDMTWVKLISYVLGDVKTAMSKAREDIVSAGEEIAKIKDVPDLDKGATEKLEKIGSSLESMGKAMDGLRSIRDSQNFDVSGWIGDLFGGVDIGQALESVKQDIYDASEALKKFDGVETIPDDVGNNLKKVADSLKSVGDSITTLRKLRDDYNWDVGAGSLFGGSDIKTSFDNIKKDLVDVSNSLKSLGGEEGELGNIGKDVPKKIKKVADTLDSVLKVIDKMNEFKGKGDGTEGTDFTNVVKTIDNARESLITISGSLKKLGGNSEGEGGLETIGEEVKGKLKSVSKTLSTLSSTMNTLKGFPVVSGNEIPNRVQKAVTVISNSARHLNSLNGVKSVDESVGTLISNVGKYGGRLSRSVSKLKDFPVVSGNEIPTRVQKAVTVVKNTARHLNGLNGTKSVPQSVGTVITNVGKYGGRMKTTIRKLKGFPVVSGDEIPTRVQKAVTAVKNTAKHLNNLKGTSVKGGVGSILTAVSKAVKELRTTLKDISPGFKSNGQDIGSSLKSGIKTGMSGLSGTVSTGVSSAVTASTGTATTGGSTLGTSMVNGFKSSFLLSSTIQLEMAAGLSAITTATPDLTNAMGALADQMVQEFKSHAEIASPGAIARSIRDEMGYTRGFVDTHGRGVITSVGNLATNMVNNFNPNLRESIGNLSESVSSRLNQGRVNALYSMNGDSVNNRQSTGSGSTTIVIGEGAVQLDARNMTTTESRQIMINAIEGLDSVESVNIKGA